MEESVIGPAEINSIAYLNKKRKIQAELLGIPLPKHVCWGQTLEHDSSSDSCIEPKNVKGIIFARGAELDQESSKDSYSFHVNSDSLISPCSKTLASLEPSTSSAGCGGPTSSEIDLYSLQSRSLTKSSFSKSGPLSTSREVDCINDYGLYASDDYDDLFLQLENHADCSCSEQCTHTDLDHLLYSNEAAPNNFVLSSGRWSVNQGADAQQGSPKLTIDQEFEQYFSMLML